VSGQGSHYTILFYVPMVCLFQSKGLVTIDTYYRIWKLYRKNDENEKLSLMIDSSCCTLQ